MSRGPYRVPPLLRVAPSSLRADRLDFMLLVSMCVFCALPIGSALSEGRVGPEASLALLLLGAVLRIAQLERGRPVRSARRWS